MIPSLYQDTVSIYRRTAIGSATRDSLNNPVYGTPTSGAGWSAVYTNILVKLAFASSIVQFAPVGERPTPTGIMYSPASYTINPEDRVLTSGGVEYVVTSVVPGYVMPNVVDHYEMQLELP